MTAIETTGLTKFYGEVRGIEEVSLTVERGEIFGFLGPNGAGKTTTIRTLLGFLNPSRGAATVLGHDIRDPAALREAKRNVGYIPSELGFDGDVTGRRILDLHGELKGDSRREELLSYFEPPLDREVEAYSRGNVQKLAIVGAFMHDPDLVVMDEPTAGLDPLMQETFYAFVREEVAAGKTMFFSSHNLGEVRKVCDRVGIIRNGRLVAVEPVADLLDRSGRLVRVRLGDGRPDGVDLAGVHDLEHVDGSDREGVEVQFMFSGNYDALVEWLAARRVLDLEIEEAPLEDVFMTFYGDAPEDPMAGEPAAESVSGEARPGGDR